MRPCSSGRRMKSFKRAMRKVGAGMPSGGVRGCVGMCLLPDRNSTLGLCSNTVPCMAFGKVVSTYVSLLFFFLFSLCSTMIYRYHKQKCFKASTPILTTRATPTRTVSSQKCPRVSSCSPSSSISKNTTGSVIAPFRPPLFKKKRVKKEMKILRHTREMGAASSLLHSRACILQGG